MSECPLCSQPVDERRVDWLRRAVELNVKVAKEQGAAVFKGVCLTLAQKWREQHRTEAVLRCAEELEALVRS